MLGVFVDGQSVVHMQHNMLESEDWFNLREFYLALTERIGTERKLAFQPMVTVPDARNAWAKALRSAGFRTHEVSSRGARDDKAIIDAINNLDETVREIVIVSSDQDYVSALRKQVNRGVKVYWVATRTLARGRLSISKVLEQLFDRGEFEFVELARFLEKLHPSDPDASEIQIVLKMEGNAAHEMLITEVEKLKQRIPGLTYTIEHATRSSTVL